MSDSLTPRDDRAVTPEMQAELFEGARYFVEFERFFAAFGGAGRRATIRSLQENARKIGFPPSAVDGAVTDAIANAEREPDTRGKART